LPISTEAVVFPPLVDVVGAAVPLLGVVVAVAEVVGAPPGGLAVELQPASPKAIGATARPRATAASLDAGVWARIVPRFVD
jgi:hypothetical protein